MKVINAREMMKLCVTRFHYIDSAKTYFIFFIRNSEIQTLALSSEFVNWII